jgi:hypothetical protein
VTAKAKKKRPDMEALQVLSDMGYLFMPIKSARDRWATSFDRELNRMTPMLLMRIAAPQGSALYEALQKSEKAEAKAIKKPAPKKTGAKR